MPRLNFQKKIGDKDVRILVQTGNKQNGKETYGVSMLCPWCGKLTQSTGYSTPKQAAKWFFDDLKIHYNRKHKP